MKKMVLSIFMILLSVAFQAQGMGCCAKRPKRQVLSENERDSLLAQSLDHTLLDHKDSNKGLICDPFACDHDSKECRLVQMMHTIPTELQDKIASYKAYEAGDEFRQYMAPLLYQEEGTTYVQRRNALQYRINLLWDRWHATKNKPHFASPVIIGFMNSQSDFLHECYEGYKLYYPDRLVTRKDFDDFIGAFYVARFEPNTYFVHVWSDGHIELHFDDAREKEFQAISKSKRIAAQRLWTQHEKDSACSRIKRAFNAKCTLDYDTHDRLGKHAMEMGWKALFVWLLYQGGKMATNSIMSYMS